MTEKKANFVCLDVGSHKISALAAHISSESEVDVMAHGLYASAGIKCGTVVDSQKAEGAINKALSNLEKKINHHIDTVVVSFSGAKARSSYLDHSLILDNRAVTKNDISLLVAKSVRSSSSKDSSVVHCFPIEFLVDGVKVRNPVGMICEKLSASMHIVTADSVALLNISNCFAKYHVRVEEFALAPIASGVAYFACNPEDRGAVVIDYGCTTTSVTVFYDNVPVFSDYVPLGGWHISNDISQVLGFDFLDAERIKVLYSNVREDAPALTLDVDIKDQSKKVDCLLLNEVVRARILEILSMIKGKYEQLENVDAVAAKNMVFTGATSAIPGLESLCGSILQISRVQDFARHYEGSLLEETDVQSYSAVLGMLAYRMRYYSNYYSSSSLLIEQSGIWKKFWTYLKEVF